MQLTAAMTRGRQIYESLDLADKLDAADDPAVQQSSFAFTLPAMHHSASLSDAEVERYRTTMRQRIERRVERGQEKEAASACVGLANHYRTRAEPEQAVAYYEKALDLDPEYALRPHYWFELAGVLFGLHRYDEAAEAYSKAIELGTEEIAPFLRADALLFAGRYGEAREEIANLLQGKSSFGIRAEFVLKDILLTKVVDGLGLHKQHRDLDKSNDFVAVDDLDPADTTAIQERLMTALRYDALNAAAWWNLGNMHQDRGQMDLSGAAMLNAALCYESDPDAWANATIVKWAYGEPELVPALVVTGQRLTQGALLPRIGEMAAEQPADFPRSLFMEGLAKLDEDLSDGPDETYSVRLLKPDGEVEVVKMPTAGHEPHGVDE